MKSILLASTVAAVSAANFVILDIPHTQPSGAVVGLNTTFHYNLNACNPDRKLPLAILLNGAPVLAEQYADVARKMADQGYAVAIPEYSQRSGVINDPTCSVQSPPFPAASNANSIDKYITSAKPDFLACTNTDQILLLGHSAGGAAAFFAADGSCKGFSGKFIPQCEGFTDILDSNGNNKVKGVLVFEGTAGASTLPQGMFAGIVSSTYGGGDEYVSAYEAITADRKVLLSYKAMNHYSVNNWNDGDDAPCGGPRSGEEANFVEDEANHEEGTTLIADAFVQMTNAFLYADSSAVDFLESGAKQNPRFSLSRMQN
jgi:dienelactone hydrolase